MSSTSFDKDKDTAVCCDCKKRADLPYFMCESEDKKSFLCAKCYINQMIQFAIENGYVPGGVGSNPTMFYNNKEILEDFCFSGEYYPNSD